MTYLITGATGLVGNVIKALCLAKGIKVHYLTTSRNKIEISDNLHGFYWNPKNGEIDLTAFEGVYKIIHLAGATVAKKWTKSYKEEILESRTLGSRLLLDTLSKISHKVSQVVSASAIGIYPNSMTNYYMETSLEEGDDFLAQVVRQWENEIDIFSSLDIKVCKIRVGLVLSTQGGALPKMAQPVKMCVGSAFGNGKQWQSWIHVEDLANIFLFAAKHNLEGIFNGVAPNAVSQKKLIQLIGRTVKRPVFMPNIPAPVIKLLLGEMSTLLLTSQRVCSGKIIQHGFEFKFPNLEGALINLL